MRSSAPSMRFCSPLRFPAPGRTSAPPWPRSRPKRRPVGIPKDCLFASSNGPVAMPVSEDPAAQAHDATCQPKRDAFYTLDSSPAAPVMALMAPFPLIAGLLLGVPLVGREIEWGTAPLAWTLGRSRRRWLLARAVPLGIALGLILVVPALAAQALQSARDPLVSPWLSFTDSGLRGSIL